MYGVDGLSSYTFDEALSELDEALVHRQVILDAKESKIDSLKSQLEKADDYEARLSVLTTLIDEYKHFDVDSLKVYYREAISLSSLHGDSVVARRLWLDEIGHMPVRERSERLFCALTVWMSIVLTRMRRWYFLKRRVGLPCVPRRYIRPTRCIAVISASMANTMIL